MPITGRVSIPSIDIAQQAEEGAGAMAIGLLRAVCAPANLLLVAVIAFGWFALIGWTGAGPDGWQARLCADLDLQPRGCAAMSMATEPGRDAVPGSAGRSS